MKKMNWYHIIHGFWWTIFVLLLWALLTGCARKIYVPVEHKITETITLRDTVVQVRLDVIRDSVVTPDTVSNLENKYAASSAGWIRGNLHHSLRTKDASLPVEIQYVEKEKIIETPQPYPVEVIKKVEKKLSTWQQIRIWLGNVFLAGLGGVSVIGLYRIRKGKI